jgi:hypothetical protein
MGTAAIEQAVNLMSIDVDAITKQATASLVEAETKALLALPDDQLFAEVAKIEAELKKAQAALQCKQANATPDATIGPCTIFEGSPIDCGKVAKAAIAAVEDLEAMAEADLKSMATDVEAQLQKAKAALDQKRSGGAPPATKAAPPAAQAVPPAARAAETAVSAPARPSTAPASTPAAPETPCKAPAENSVPNSSVLTPTLTGVAVAAVVGAAAAAGAAILGAFRRR